MNPNKFDLQAREMIEIQCEDRWQVHRRLQELGISCQCSYHQPLKVKADSATTAVQVWSVVKQTTMSRQALADWLEGCWKVHSSSRKNRERRNATEQATKQATEQA